jgi:hypothetical protein
MKTLATFSRADVPAMTLAEQTIKPARKQVSITFVIPYPLVASMSETATRFKCIFSKAASFALLTLKRIRNRFPQKNREALFYPRANQCRFYSVGSNLKSSKPMFALR